MYLAISKSQADAISDYKPNSCAGSYRCVNRSISTNTSCIDYVVYSLWVCGEIKLNYTSSLSRHSDKRCRCVSPSVCSHKIGIASCEIYYNSNPVGIRKVNVSEDFQIPING